MTSIREERNKARELVKSGIDPRAKKKVVKIEAQAAIEATIKADEQKRSSALTFNDLYSIWIKDGVNRSDGNKYIIQAIFVAVLIILATTGSSRTYRWIR